MITKRERIRLELRLIKMLLELVWYSICKSIKSYMETRRRLL